MLRNAAECYAMLRGVSLYRRHAMSKARTAAGMTICSLDAMWRPNSEPQNIRRNAAECCGLLRHVTICYAVSLNPASAMSYKQAMSQK